MERGELLRYLLRFDERLSILQLLGDAPQQVGGVDWLEDQREVVPCMPGLVEQIDGGCLT